MDLISSEWQKADNSMLTLIERHRLYETKLDEIESLQKTLRNDILNNRRNLEKFQNLITKKQSSSNNSDVNEYEDKVQVRLQHLNNMELSLPQKNGWVVSLHLGSINATFLRKDQRRQYKEEYERYKLIVTIVNLILAFFNLFILNARITDSIYHFLLVWYYCTVTLREHILRTNGSHIKGWWMIHHYISTAVSGVLLVWPMGKSYQSFRSQFYVFSMIVGLVQLLQYHYQRRVIYTLQALGHKGQMDVTVEGFRSWMWRGLSFIIPFLLVIYVFEFYNAYILILMAFEPDCVEWQVPVVGGMFLVLSIGNFIALFQVIVNKCRSRGPDVFAKKIRYKTE